LKTILPKKSKERRIFSMYSLTKEQKISNLNEILEQKKKKLENLTKEVQNLEAKIAKIEKSKKE
jgi:uncharacterized protein YlxW (UPF0749 family)